MKMCEDYPHIQVEPPVHNNIRDYVQSRLHLRRCVSSFVGVLTPRLRKSPRLRKKKLKK